MYPLSLRCVISSCQQSRWWWPLDNFPNWIRLGKWVGYWKNMLDGGRVPVPVGHCFFLRGKICIGNVPFPHSALVVNSKTWHLSPFNHQLSDSLNRRSVIHYIGQLKQMCGPVGMLWFYRKSSSGPGRQDTAGRYKKVTFLSSHCARRILAITKNKRGSERDSNNLQF